MKQKIIMSVNVPENVIAAFVAAGWTINPPTDAPVVSGAIVDSELVWDKDGDPIIPREHSISCPDAEGYCKIDGIED